MTNQVECVLECLRSNTEGCKQTNKDGSVWADVYLDNARQSNISVYEFRACLAALSKQGLYKVLDGTAWGCVKM